MKGNRKYNFLSASRSSNDQAYQDTLASLGIMGTPLRVFPKVPSAPRQYGIERFKGALELGLDYDEVKFFHSRKKKNCDSIVIARVYTKQSRLLISERKKNAKTMPLTRRNILKNPCL